MAYDNTARETRARQTRSRVLAAAHEAFLAAGFAGTTIRQIAQQADVSPETVYKTFGSKAGLLKAVYDVALAGDEDAVPIAQRPEFIAVAGADSPAAAARAYGVLAGWLSLRSGPLLRVVLANRGGDADLEAFAATIDSERLIGATMAIRAWRSREWLAPGLTDEHARDMLWTLNSTAVYLLLDERGWTNTDYQNWLAATVFATIFNVQPGLPVQPRQIGHLG